MFSFRTALKIRRPNFPSGMFFFVGFPNMFFIVRTVDEMIRKAITEKKLLEFDYDGYHRIVEPHVYGRKNEKNEILTYQQRGQSSSGVLGWKRMYMNKIANMRVLDETFPGSRPVPNKHSTWDLIYLIVER